MVQRTGKSFNEWTWLEWLVKVRVIVITFVLAIELTITNLTITNVNRTLFVTVILLWYSISALHILLVALWHDWEVQAKLQIFTDLVFTTAVVYVTGGIDTSFNFIYPLIIIVASVLLSQWWVYLTAAVSFILLGATLELVHFELLRSYSMTRSDLRSLQAVISSSTCLRSSPWHIWPANSAPVFAKSGASCSRRAERSKTFRRCTRTSSTRFRADSSPLISAARSSL
jgi:hypothetical protein